jgi:glutathione S-transferase
MTIELHTWDTPYGRKISIALEEMELPYVVTIVDLRKGDQHDPEFLKISPNGKIPAIVDPDGPDGKPVSVFESGAILFYLGEKSGKFWPRDLAARIPVLEWLMFQQGGFGPIPGQVHHFVTVESDADRRYAALVAADAKPTASADDEFFDTKDADTVATIKDLIETRVRPAVAGDGGDIVFRGFRDGIVRLHMQGACSGCPSSSATHPRPESRRRAIWAVSNLQKSGKAARSAASMASRSAAAASRISTPSGGSEVSTPPGLSVANSVTRSMMRSPAAM